MLRVSACSCCRDPVGQQPGVLDSSSSTAAVTFRSSSRKWTATAARFGSTTAPGIDSIPARSRTLTSEAGIGAYLPLCGGRPTVTQIADANTCSAPVFPEFSRSRSVCTRRPEPGTWLVGHQRSVDSRTDRTGQATAGTAVPIISRLSVRSPPACSGPQPGWPRDHNGLAGGASSGRHPTPSTVTPQIGNYRTLSVSIGSSPASQGQARLWSGIGFEGDLVAERSELTDVVASPALWADAVVVEVRAEVVVVDLRVGRCLFQPRDLCANASAGQLRRHRQGYTKLGRII